MITQKDAIRELLTEQPDVSCNEAITLIKSKHHIAIQPPMFYSVRSDMGYGTRRNGRIRLTADSISRVREFVDNTKIEGFASTLITILDEMGYATFKESLKVVAQLEKSK